VTRPQLWVVGRLAIAAGAAVLLWVATVWIWQDPFTALYTAWEQHELRAQYDRRVAAFHPILASSAEGEVAAIRLEARRYRADSHQGEAMGLIDVPRLDLNMVLVDGTDEAALEKGPGIYRGDYLPGEHQLVYVAGHRTTFLAPFADINELRDGDKITIHLPYGTFTYVVYRSRIVVATNLAVLRSHDRDIVTLQACHPRFFATHRYLVYGRLAAVRTANGKPVPASLLPQP
jgi:sortase A